VLFQASAPVVRHGLHPGPHCWPRSHPLLGPSPRSAVSSWQLVVSPSSNHRSGQQFPSALVDATDALLLTLSLCHPLLSCSPYLARSWPGLAMLFAGEIIAWGAWVAQTGVRPGPSDRPHPMQPHPHPLSAFCGYGTPAGPPHRPATTCFNDMRANI
jgi:hypothetical protein